MFIDMVLASSHCMAVKLYLPLYLIYHSFGLPHYFLNAEYATSAAFGLWFKKILYLIQMKRGIMGVVVCKVNGHHCQRKCIWCHSDGNVMFTQFCQFFLPHFLTLLEVIATGNQIKHTLSMNKLWITIWIMVSLVKFIHFKAEISLINFKSALYFCILYLFFGTS